MSHEQHSHLNAPYRAFAHLSGTIPGSMLARGRLLLVLAVGRFLLMLARGRLLVVLGRGRFLVMLGSASLLVRLPPWGQMSLRRKSPNPVFNCYECIPGG